MESQENFSRTQHTILLDISLFVLDMLSPEKIKEKYLQKDDGVILEVPSAFITMIIDAQAGNSLLREFIDVNLTAIKNNPLHKISKESKIQALVNSTEEVFKELKDVAYRTILNDFAPLITDISKTDQIEKRNNQEELDDYPIKIYEPIEPVSQDELHSLRMTYLRELNLLPHPIYDLYFLQIYHAQTSGFYGGQTSKRELLSVGRATYKTIKIWRENLFGEIPEEYVTTEIKGQKFAEKVNDASIEFLKYFIASYLRPVWQTILIDGFDSGVDIAFTLIKTGRIEGSDIALTIITLYGKKMVVKGVKSMMTKSSMPVDQSVGYILLGLLLLLFVCLFPLGNIFFLPKKAENVIIPQIILTITDVPLSLVTDIPQPTLTVFPEQTLSTFSTDSLIIENTPTLIVVNIGSENQSPDYCMYVIQSNDTLQSVASHFRVSEELIKSENPLVSQNIFVVNQLIKVNTSCCTAINNNGFSYFVLPNDDLFSLATRYSTSVEAIALANNLSNPRYIQAGQMLCIPFP